jgi:hypothetical protein
MKTLDKEKLRLRQKFGCVKPQDPQFFVDFYGTHVQMLCASEIGLDA